MSTALVATGKGMETSVSGLQEANPGTNDTPRPTIPRGSHSGLVVPEKRFDRAKMVRMIRLGESNRAIANACGVSETAIRKARVKAGFEALSHEHMIPTSVAVAVRDERPRSVVSEAVQALLTEAPDASEFVEIKERLFGLAARGSGAALAGAFLAQEGIRRRVERLSRASVAAADEGLPDPDCPVDSQGKPCDPEILQLGKAADYWAKVTRAGLETLRVAIGLAAVPGGKGGGGSGDGGTTVNVNVAAPPELAPDELYRMMKLLPKDDPVRRAFVEAGRMLGASEAKVVSAGKDGRTEKKA